MRQRLAWFSAAPLMFAGLIAGHSVGYRVTIGDPHARADALAHSGHGYLGYAPLALTICLGALLTGLLLQGRAGFRGESSPRAVASPFLVLLPPAAFFAQEFVERLVHTGHTSWTIALQPAFLVGLALQLPFALAALLVAWMLDRAARAIGHALSVAPAPRFSLFVPAPVGVAAAPRVDGLARGYGERAPPFLRRP